MHRSRIGVVLVDHPEAEWEESLAFWAAAHGSTPVAEEGEESEYRTIGRIGSVLFASQRTGAGTPPRVHLDIETDDVPAEVARVLALGASVVDQRPGYTILSDPSGLVFCVVPVQSGDDFEREARTWDD